MTGTFDHNSDGELRELFGAVTPPVSDDGFSRRVVEQVQTSLWKRRVVLSVAAFAGLTLAAPAVTELLLYASEQFQQLTNMAMGLLQG